MRRVFAPPFTRCASGLKFALIAPSCGLHPTSRLLRVKDVRAILFSPLIRVLERILPMPLLILGFHTLAFWRALASRLLKGPRGVWRRPPWLQDGDTFQPRWLDRLPLYANRALLFFPDRLHRPKWQRRCRYVGLEYLRAAAGCQGVIVAFVHLGPYPLLRSWLRAAGVPVSMLVSYPARERSRFLRRHHERTRFPEIPAAFHLEKLADAIRHLQAGRVLAMALDSKHGRMMDVPLPGGWTFRSATGAIRLARKHGATLLAATIHCEGPWRFVVEVSPPVPPEMWAEDDATVGAWLFQFLFPRMRRHADQCLPRLVELIQPAPARSEAVAAVA